MNALARCFARGANGERCVCVCVCMCVQRGRARPPCSLEAERRTHRGALRGRRLVWCVCALRPARASAEFRSCDVVRGRAPPTFLSLSCFSFASAAAPLARAPLPFYASSTRLRLRHQLTQPHPQARKPEPDLGLLA